MFELYLFKVEPCRDIIHTVPKIAYEKDTRIDFFMPDFNQCKITNRTKKYL